MASIALLTLIPSIASAQLFGGGGGGSCGLLCQIVAPVLPTPTPTPAPTPGPTAPPPGEYTPPTATPTPGSGSGPTVPGGGSGETDDSAGGGGTGGSGGSGGSVPTANGSRHIAALPNDTATPSNTGRTSPTELGIDMAGRNVSTRTGASPSIQQHWRTEIATNRRGDAAASLIIAADGSNIPAGSFSGLQNSFYTDLANCAQCMEPGCAARGVIWNGECACDRSGAGIPYACN